MGTFCTNLSRPGTIAAALLALATILASSAAADTLDQQYDPASGFADSGSSFSQEIGQTFTVGVAGTLSRIEAKIFKIFAVSDDAVLTVYSTNGSGLPNAALGSATFSGAALTGSPTFRSFDFSSYAIPVSVGNVLAFGLSSSAGGVIYMSSDPAGTYSGGQAVRRTLGPPIDPWQFQTGKDYAFKTYVNALIVDPLPGDFDDDLDVDSADIDILWHIVRGTGTDPNNNDSADLNGDGVANEDDVDNMLAVRLSVGVGRHYGDADLVGGVGPDDFTAWRVGGSGWAHGDFDGTGDVGPDDFTLWRTAPTTYPSNVGPRPGSEFASVPEPSSLLLAALGLIVLAAKRTAARV